MRTGKLVKNGTISAKISRRRVAGLARNTIAYAAGKAIRLHSAAASSDRVKVWIKALAKKSALKIVTQFATVKSGCSRKLRTDQKVMASRKPSGTTKNRSCHAKGGAPSTMAKRRAAAFERSDMAWSVIGHRVIARRMGGRNDGYDSYMALNSDQASFQASMFCFTGVCRMKILPSLYSSMTLRLSNV